MSDLVLPIDAFIRAFAVNKGVAYGFFLGAGASVSSGVPSAARCIWEWKRAIFATNHPGLEEQFAEISLPSVRERIQRWLDSQRCFPAVGSAEEYGYFIERCYPVAEDRRLYFAGKIQEAKPHVGYKALCALAEAEHVDAVWTTNFDGLPQRTAAGFKATPVEVGIDSQDRLPRLPRRGELLCVSMHGDYRYDALKNTPAEVQEQESALRTALIDYCVSHPLIVCGYSGRDESVMEALKEAFRRPGTSSIVWCGFDDLEPPAVVAEVLETARSNGRRAHYVPTQGFDDVLVRLALHCLQGDALQRVRGLLAEFGQNDRAPQAQFSIPDGSPIGTLIRSNAFEVECPSEVLEFDMLNWPTEKVWSWLDEYTRGSNVVAVPYRGKVLALGTIDDTTDLFRGRIKGKIERTPIGDADLGYENGAVVSLLRSSVVRSIARARGLRTNGKDVLWQARPYEERSFDETRYPVHEAALLGLRAMAGRSYLTVKPTLVLSDGSTDVPREAIDGIKRAVLGWQHNAKFHAAVDKWREQIFGDSREPSVRFEWPPDCGSSFRFDVRRTPLFAEVASSNRPTLTLDDKVRQHVKQRGLEVPEPCLLFASKRGVGVVKDTHPIRGILKNRPYDFSLSERGLVQGIRVGVVCPGKEARALSRFLAGMHAQHRPANTERDYLLDYPGLTSAFGVSVELPSPGEVGWETYAEPPEEASAFEGGLALGRNIVRAIEALRAGYGPTVVAVLTPERFERWRRAETESESFDLHDFVKAYCAPRGIATQFLKEDTFDDEQRCRLWWWLALALYVKSMRTPWVLDGLDPDTAFVGLGFSIDRHAPRGQHVILGCSHIYNSRGEGLQYRLTKLENPVVRRGNAFMSLESARQVGEMVRQLFYEAKLKLPARVVVHKQTPFLRDEVTGLLQGLGGVDEVEMLEVNVDSTLRYVSSKSNPGGRLAADSFPVGRGTVVVIEPHAALLWVHGATAALNDRLRYFQGKRRIPAPLMVKRHLGSSAIATIAAEILGLSKMNWNTFDLYGKLPATIESSGCIARIGSRLERFGPTPYDYRLFI